MQWSDRIGRRLKPRDLHVFLAVADNGNMAKAAEQLAISRPVVSKTIADLEHTLGVRLLDRTPKGVEPTLYGRALLRRSLAVFDELRQGVSEIESLSDPDAGELRVGCTEVMAAGLLSAVINKLSRHHPRLVVRMELGSASTNLDLLRNRTCEIVVGRPPVGAPLEDLESKALFCERLNIVAGAQSKWARRRRLKLKDLMQERWIQARHEVSPTGPTYEAFKAAGLPLPRISIFSESLNLRYSLLATGEFLTMIPGSVLRFGPDRAAIKVLALAAPRWRFPTCILTLKNRTLTPLAQRFIDCVRDTAAPLAKA